MSVARNFEELLAWQLMHELNIEVWKATEHARASRDFDFRDQIRDAADSTERNIAEGFGRTLLKKGLSSGYFTVEDFDRLDRLAIRGLQAVARFQRYLRSPAA